MYSIVFDSSRWRVTDRTCWLAQGEIGLIPHHKRGKLFYTSQPKWEYLWKKTKPNHFVSQSMTGLVSCQVDWTRLVLNGGTSFRSLEEWTCPRERGVETSSSPICSVQFPEDEIK